MIQLPRMPENIAKLPRDERGYPVPYFVPMIDGKPEFRVASSQKIVSAIDDKKCWVCGQFLNPASHVFVVGPMAAINQITSEPPCHKDCAEFSAMACPFLAKPQAKRREAGLPETTFVPGIGVDNNPKVTLLWQCRGYEVVREGRGLLFRIPNPSRVWWFREGRKALRHEIIEAISDSFQRLKDQCGTMPDVEVQELQLLFNNAMKLVPN